MSFESLSVQGHCDKAVTNLFSAPKDVRDCVSEHGNIETYPSSEIPRSVGQVQGMCEASVSPGDWSVTIRRHLTLFPKGKTYGTNPVQLFLTKAFKLYFLLKPVKEDMSSAACRVLCRRTKHISHHCTEASEM